MLAELASVVLLSYGSLCAQQKPIEPEPIKHCTTWVSVLIWSEDSEEAFRLTVPVDCLLAQAIPYDQNITNKFTRVPFLFEQLSDKKWRATVVMKDWKENPVSVVKKQ